MRNALLMVMLVLIAAACAPFAENTVRHTLLDQEARVAAEPEYRITIGDELEVKFLNNAELNERIPVRPDGRISLPMAKQIHVAGLTTSQLESILRDKYAPELKKPDITVIVRGFNNQKIFVDGEVARVGALPVMGSITVSQAIAQSGGFKETARLSEVLVIRRTKEKPVVTILDMRKFQDNTDMSQDISLMPFDMVFVPRSKIANVDLWVDQYIRRMIPFSLPQVIPTPAYVYPSASSPSY